MHHPLIFITDSFPNADGGGISQTLYHLFNRYPQKMWILLEEAEKVPQTEAKIQASIIRYKDTGPILWKNRLGKWFNPWLKALQFANRQKAELPAGLPNPKEVRLLVSTTSPEKLHWAWLLAKKGGYTVIPYFMDDWMDGQNFEWRGNSIQKIVADLLHQAPLRLMISRQLTERLTKRYKLSYKPVLELHNPCTGSTNGEAAAYQKGLMIYAGSIWPMHADALIALAKAVHLLQQQGNAEIKLMVYSPPSHWQQYMHVMVGQGVEYGGFLPYEAVRRVMANGWLLVCTASFQAAFEAFSASSIQTKLTDYVAAGKPVLVVAPGYAACGMWAQQYNCGYWVSCCKPTEIAAELQHIYADKSNWQDKAAKSSYHAAHTFSEKLIQEKLYQFLAN
jgi:glycosyltransferase involved in cell wall biosynthesis